MHPHPHSPAQDPHRATAHLTPELWENAERRLIRKALAEFSHERLLTPAEEPGRPGHYTVPTDDGALTYRFTARRYALDHWHIDADSITRHDRDGTRLPLSALDFFVELRTTLGLSDTVLPVYLEEISSTLAGSAYKLAGELGTDPTSPTTPATPAAHRPGAAELARADFQTIEAGMTEGHPCFVANNGRLGLDSAEYHAYAPETGSPVQLVWLAARRDLTTFASSAGLDYDRLISGELSPPPRTPSPPGSPPSASTRTTTGSCPSTPGSGRTASPSPSPAKSPGATSSSSAAARTPTAPSSRSVPSSTPAPPASTTSKPRCPSSTWAFCAVSPPRTWPSPPPSTTGCTTSSPATSSWAPWASASCASAPPSATTTASTRPRPARAPRT